MNPSWICLVVAGLLEVVWALALKASSGFTRPLPTVLFFAALLASMALLSQAVKTLPLGTAYAVWVGIGAAGAAIATALLHGEHFTPLRVFFFVLLVVSIIGLKLSSPAAS